MFHFHASFYKTTNQTNEVECEEIPLFQTQQLLKPVRIVFLCLFISCSQVIAKKKKKKALQNFSAKP